MHSKPFFSNCTASTNKYPQQHAKTRKNKTYNATNQVMRCIAMLISERSMATARQNRRHLQISISKPQTHSNTRYNPAKHKTPPKMTTFIPKRHLKLTIKSDCRLPAKDHLDFVPLPVHVSNCIALALYTPLLTLFYLLLGRSGRPTRNIP